MRDPTKYYADEGVDDMNFADYCEEIRRGEYVDDDDDVYGDERRYEMRNANRLILQITSGIAIAAAAFEAATRNWRCAAYAACCAILFRTLIRDDIFIEQISNEIKRLIKGDKK